MIDTTSVEGRRTLRFATLDDMLSDARTCARAGHLRTLGNWTLGQALHHVAAWIEYPYVGYPPQLVLPDSVKAQACAAKERIMREPMRPGERLPLAGVDDGTLATEVVPTDVGLARLESAATLLRSGEPKHADPAFGPVTAREWTQMTLRHAELHFSFFVPE